MKIAASDFDGTLFRNGTVTEEEKEAIINWRKKGNLFGIITGRNYASLKEDLDPLNVEYDFIISTNGALIRNEKCEVLRSFEVDTEIAKELLELGIKHNAIWSELMYLDSFHRRVIEHRTADGEMNINREIFNETKSFHQMSFTFPDIEDALALTDHINETYKGKVSAYSLIYGNTANIDIVKSGISKASALYTLGEIKNVAKEDIITFGDNFNDIPMIREFDGYIMSSAIEEVRKLANKTCSSLCEVLL